MVLLPSGFLTPLHPDIIDMINDQDIEHMISPTRPPDYPLISYLSGRGIKSLKSESVPKQPNEMAPKRTSTSVALAMTHATIRKLVADSVAVALEAQAATMENTDNTYRNTEQRETLVARKCSYKELFNFKGKVTTLKPQTLEEAITITQMLMDQGRPPDQELQKQRASHWKQLTTSVSDLSCLRREKELQKSVPENKQQCPWEGIRVGKQECPLRPKRSH
nr:hypothetical protein [Tanacetum cinerariifolium]